MQKRQAEEPHYCSGWEHERAGLVALSFWSSLHAMEPLLPFFLHTHTQTLLSALSLSSHSTSAETHTTWLRPRRLVPSQGSAIARLMGIEMVA